MYQTPHKSLFAANAGKPLDQKNSEESDNESTFQKVDAEASVAGSDDEDEDLLGMNGRWYYSQQLDLMNLNNYGELNRTPASDTKLPTNFQAMSLNPNGANSPAKRGQIYAPPPRFGHTAARHNTATKEADNDKSMIGSSDKKKHD